MDNENAVGSDGRSKARLVGRVDRMVAAGRLTDEEARRLRAAGDDRRFDSIVRDIRLRHAGARLGAAVEDGTMSREEADGYLDRLRDGKHPRSLRAKLRNLGAKRLSQPTTPGATRPDQGAGDDNQA